MCDWKALDTVLSNAVRRVMNRISGMLSEVDLLVIGCLKVEGRCGQAGRMDIRVVLVLDW